MLISLILKHKIKPKIKSIAIIPKPQNTPFQKIFFEKTFGIKTLLEIEEKYKNKFFTVNLKNLQNCKNFYYLAVLNLGWRKQTIKITKEWLSKDGFINPSHPEIKNIAKKLKANSEIQTVKNAFKFVVENLKYDRPIKGLYSVNSALEVLKGKSSGVDCGGFSTLLISILRSLNIPSRLAVGFLIKPKKLNTFLSIFNFAFLIFNFLTMHAWVEVFTKEKGFLSLDPSVYWRYKKGMSKRKTFWSRYFEDRIVFSYGEELKFKNHKIDLLQHVIYL